MLCSSIELFKCVKVCSQTLRTKNFTSVNGNKQEIDGYIVVFIGAVIYRKMFDTNVTVKEYDRIFTSYDFWDSLSEFDYVLTNSWDSYKSSPQRLNT